MSRNQYVIKRPCHVEGQKCSDSVHMRSEKRRSYLDEKWHRYPPINEKVLTFAEVKSEFKKLTSGAPVKVHTFWIAGRVSMIVKSALSDLIEQISIAVDGEEISLRMDKLNNHTDSMELVQDILNKNDLVLLKVDWHHINTSGLFPKIETIHPTEVVLLAPALSEPLHSEMSIQRAKQWEHFLGLVRKCFEFLQFTEVKTPTLVKSPGLEPFIDPFKTEFRFGSEKAEFYLPTSPEFHLKKVLSLGMTRIFEMKDSFRNGELSEHHQPEFTMLEWYRAYSNLDAIIKDLRGLLNYLKLHWPAHIKGWGPLRETTMAEVFKEVLDFELSVQTTKEDLVQLAHELELSPQKDDSWNDVFHRIFIEKIEPHLGHTQPVVVRNFPPSQAAWARLTSDGWADRFELFWRGVELANAFHELNDPVEQRQRFEAANRERQALGKSVMPMDEELLRALESGMPPSGGIALGLDRLFMLLVDASDIKSTRFFGVCGEL